MEEESLKKLHRLTEKLDPKGPEGKKLPPEVRFWMAARKQTVAIRRPLDERTPA